MGETTGLRDRGHPGRLPCAIGVALVAGCAEPGPPTARVVTDEPPWFEECAADRGLVFTHDSGHRGRYLFPEIVSGGVAVLDVDGDGDLDVYFVQGGNLADDPATRPSNRLFRNTGQGRFEDVTEGSGADHRGYGMGVATGDYDGDGRPDLYVTNVGTNVLLRNRGDGTFEDVTARAGVGHPGWGTSATFVDYDHDGDLDLFVANYVVWSIEGEQSCQTVVGRSDYCSPNKYPSMPDVLYRNDGDGTFSDVSTAARLPTAFGNGLGVVTGDFDQDGRIDVFVANDQTMNQLWHNEGDGTFRDIAPLAGCALDQHGQPKAGMGTDAADVDDDGDLDVLVVNLRTESDSFFRNAGAYFVDDTGAVGLGAASRPYTRFGMAWHDFDNDGWLDLYEAAGRVRAFLEESPLSDDPYAEPDLLMRGGPDGRFTEAARRGGTAEPLVATSRAAAFGDLDDDGGMDLVVVNRDGAAHLLRNIAPRRGGWIKFAVTEPGGRHAIGATVTFGLGARRLRRDVRTAYSYCAANDPRIHVGLGVAAGVTDVRVRWMDGSEESFGDFDAGAVVRLRRGGGTVME